MPEAQTHGQPPGRLPDMQKPPPPKARLTVVESACYQSPDGEAFEACGGQNCRRGFSVELSSDERPYERYGKADQSWRPLDSGWLEGGPVSVLVIANLEESPSSRGQSPLEVGLRPPPPDRSKSTMHDVRQADPQVLPLCVLLPGELLKIPRPEHGAVRVRSSGPGGTRFRSVFVPA